MTQQVGPFENQAVANPSRPFKNWPQNHGAATATPPPLYNEPV